MKPDFVETRNYLEFIGAMTSMAARGADECLFVIVDGLPGLGKTTILQRWAATETCVYLRAKTEWKPYWMLGELLTGLGVQTVPNGYESRFRACVGALGERRLAAETARQQFAIIIDEADHVSAKSALVENLRDLTDLTRVPFVLVGMGRIRDNLTKHPATASRVNRYVPFQPADFEGVRQFLAEKCEVPVAPDLAAFVAQATRGFNREILEAIRSIEKFGLRNAPKGPDGLTLQEMAGQLLANDRKSGREIYVPGR
jgi:DNA transposition AAA+ family ATPase